MVQLALLVALGQNVLLDGALAHQPVDVHLTRLPDAVAPVLCLRSRPSTFRLQSLYQIVTYISSCNLLEIQPT